MARAPRSAFVISVSALAACAKSSQPTPPPEPIAIQVASSDPARSPTDAQLEARPDASAAPDAASVNEPVSQPLRLSDYPKTLNPRDGSGRTIKRAWQGDRCFVELPFPPLAPGQMRPPGTPPPAKDVPCPPSMLAPAYEQCRGGTLHAHPSGSQCVCFVMGNPPPPPRPIDCP